MSIFRYTRYNCLQNERYQGPHSYQADGEQPAPAIFYPELQVKTLVCILIGLKDENNTFTVILLYSLNTRLSPMLFSVVWKWEQPPGKNVPQRYLIPIYLIFLVLLIEKNKQKENKQIVYFF